MPLSDWDVVAVDEAGRPSNGTSDPSPCGIVVEVVEDALHVCSTSTWDPRSPFPNPCIGRVLHGKFDLWDVGVVAERGPRSGVVWASWFVRGSAVVGTVGVCCIGFDEAGVYVGVREEEVAHLAARMTDWARSGVVPRSLCTLGLANVLRFNQGDAFFARSMRHGLEATRPGAADMPVLYQGKRGEHLGRIRVDAGGGDR